MVEVFCLILAVSSARVRVRASRQTTISGDVHWHIYNNSNVTLRSIKSHIYIGSANNDVMQLSTCSYNYSSKCIIIYSLYIFVLCNLCFSIGLRSIMQCNRHIGL